MPGDVMPIVSAVIGAINFITLLVIAFTGGRWMGRVEVRLDHLERRRKPEAA